MKSIIAGVGAYLPEKILTSEEVEAMAGYERHGLKVGLCRMLTGCETRHYAAEGEVCSNLAAKASTGALVDAGIDACDIDALIFCSVTQDFAEPATANVVACLLGLKNAYCFDVKNACNAFLSGLDIADSLVRTGKATNVLVTSGEVLSRWTKFAYDDVDEMKTQAPVALSVGDGGGAMVVSATEGEDRRGIFATFFRTYPELWNNNVIWSGGVAYPADPDKMFVPGTTKALIDANQWISAEIMGELMKDDTWRMDDVDLLVPTQVATWLLRNISKQSGFPMERIVNVVSKWGNCGAANVPLAAYEAREKGLFREGKKILFFSGGVGYTYGMVNIIW